jgi:N-acetylmuramoyl-L-alanine amidase
VEERGLAVYYPRGARSSQTWAELAASAVAAGSSGRTIARSAAPLPWRHACACSGPLRAVSRLMPACLVELGSLSHPGDARLLQERWFLEELSRSLAGAALAWRGLELRLLEVQPQSHEEHEGG